MMRGPQASDAAWRKVQSALSGGDPFLRDAGGAPIGLSTPEPVDWTADARELMAVYLAGLSGDAMTRAAKTLHRRARSAARSQQYRTITETTVRAQIARLSDITTEGDRSR